MNASLNSCKKKLDYKTLITNKAGSWTISRDKLMNCEGSLPSQPRDSQAFKPKTQDIKKASTTIKIQAGNSNNTEKGVNSIRYRSQY